VGGTPALPESLLDGLSSTFPSTLEAYELGLRAAEVGFDWTKVEDLLDKIGEELQELRHELAAHPEGRRAKLEEEVGNLLFAAANLARFLRSDPESCLRRANQKFKQRRAALRADVQLIEWTFDPLRTRNAYLNIQRLGATARCYLKDYYLHVGSRLQQWLPSDRLIAEWELKSARVKRAASAKLRSGRRPLAEVSIPVDVGALVRSRPREPRAATTPAVKRRQRVLTLSPRPYYRPRLLPAGWTSGHEAGKLRSCIVAPAMVAWLASVTIPWTRPRYSCP
jgi:NTP pyrophosphatase (non-canonical NTP hydrolase)